MGQKRVAIIGAGLVGALQACYFQRRGYKVDIYESRADFRAVGYIGGRSINLALSVRGWTALEKIGLKEEVEKIAIPMYGRTIHQKNGEVNYQPYGQDNQAIYSVSRGDLNKRIVELADEFENVHFHFNHFCQKIDFKNKKVHFLNTLNNEELEVDTDWIIGTDGAFSRVRQSMMPLPRFQYSQFYIDYGYKELHIPAGENGQFLIDKRSLHIWPRGRFMMIALPNMDGSFTCTLFVPFEGEDAFDDLTDESTVRTYFESNFPDALQLMPSLVDDFFKNPTSSMVTIKCSPWNHKNALLMGDACHAIVPFFGQGMNCGFEDVRIFDEMIDQYTDDNELFEAFSKKRKPDSDAITQMALDNFVEMRDLVGQPDFLRMKYLEHEIMDNPEYKYTSMYQYVSFSNESYKFAYDIGQKQTTMLREMLADDQIEHKIQEGQISDYLNKI
jgi:kynurenine 3-monooxygenase